MSVISPVTRDLTLTVVYASTVPTSCTSMGTSFLTVVVATAVKKDVPIEVQEVGTVEAYTTVSVKSLVTGEITDIFFKEGDYVHKGDKLFSIDSRTYEAQLKQ